MVKRGSKTRVVKKDTADGMDWKAKRLEETGRALKCTSWTGKIPINRHNTDPCEKHGQ